MCSYAFRFSHVDLLALDDHLQAWQRTWRRPLQNTAGAGVKPAIVARALDPIRLRLVKDGAGQVRAFLLVSAPAPVIEMNQNERLPRPGHGKGAGAADRNVRGVADQGFALNPERGKEPVFYRHPTAAHRHAAGDQAEKFGKLATRNMLGLDAFDRKINFGRGLAGESAFGVHSLSTASSVAPLVIMMLTLVLTRCWPKRKVLTGVLFGRVRVMCSRVP